MDSLFLDALSCREVPRPPVWLMRQAGRYLPEYRKLKNQYSFLELCHTPELAMQVTLLPLQKFPLDAAILFADILLILNTIGFNISFGQDQGPLLKERLTLENFHQLKRENVEYQLGYITDSIKLLKKELTVPLIGFCGAPFTLATYLLEGKTSKKFLTTKKWIYHHPEKLHIVLDLLADQTIDYLKMQIKAGVDVIQIFDSWANVLPYPLLKPFCLDYIEKIIMGLADESVPIILFARGSSLFASELARLKPAAVSIDSSGDLFRISNVLPENIAIQGNFDPDILTAPLDYVESEVRRLCMAMKHRKGYIVNLGHGVKPESNEEAVKCLVETVQSISY